jgi:pilus assembly protein CpaD
MKSTSIFLRTGAAFSALVVCACAMPTIKDPAYTEDYRVRYPITVAPKMRTLHVPYRGPGAGMDPNTEAQLRQFVYEYRGNGAGAISVSTPEGWQNVGLEFAGRIAALGVPRENVLLATNLTPEAGAEVEIGFISYVAETTPCGDWSQDVASTRQNTPLPNLGCATQNNIAAMVADPRDLIGPQPMDPADTQRRLTVLEKYREGLPTPAERTEAQTGVVSQAAAQN